MYPLEMATIEGLSLQVYGGGLAKSNDEPMNVGQQKANEAT